jgi:hypothetical protein
MRTREELDLLREQAIALRIEGKSRREIEGWAQAIMTAPVQDGSQASNRLLQLPEKDLNLH